MCSALADKDRKEKNYERRKALQGKKISQHGWKVGLELENLRQVNHKTRKGRDNLQCQKDTYK